MADPSCEDVRIGETIEGLQIHSPLTEGPYYRVYGAEGDEEDWTVFAWEKIPPPEASAVRKFKETAIALEALKEPSIIPVRGPFYFKDGALGWAVLQPSGNNLGSLLKKNRVKLSEAMQAFSIISRTLQKTCEANIFHPNLQPESLIISFDEPIGKISGFLSWRVLSPSLAEMIGPQPTSPYQAPEGVKNEASMVYSLAKIAQKIGVTSPEIDLALEDDPWARPGLIKLSEVFMNLRPGFLARLFGA